MTNDTATCRGRAEKNSVQLNVRVTADEARMLDERMRQLRAFLPEGLGCRQMRLTRQQGLHAALTTWLRLPIEERQ